jgi:DHA2 family multidrug resistance protein
MQSGMHFMAMGLGFVLTMPLAGVFMDKHGPGKVVLVGFPLMAVGLVIFTVGVARHADYWPTLLAGLVIIGLGVGCTSTPLSATCVQSLAPHQVARGTTLLGVNDQVGGAMGAALMAMLLTNQFNRDDDIVAANKLAELQEGASGRGVPVDPSVIPRQNLGPDFASDVAQHFSHAYTMVFVVAVALAVLTIIPAAFLPRTSAQL